MRTFWLLALLASASSAFAQEPPETKRRIRILVNGLYNPTGIDFSETSTFPSFLEEGTSSRSFEGGKGFVFEAGAIVGIREGLGVMGTFEIFQSDIDGVFEESFPHPLYFDRPRTVMGEIRDLEYSEQAIHVDAVYTIERGKLTFDLFGGGSFFFTSTEILDDVRISSEYPFDEATVASTSTTTLDDNPIGFNAGGALTWRLTEVVGVAFQARYSHAGIEIARAEGDSMELDAGGFRVGGGIRLSF
ncbi:MAG TPA: hypothetical protein VJ921_05515 [Vicinamibacteria bacterium]|nr:hypothetical protein [Vicinamibacteria bacterium]